MPGFKSLKKNLHQRSEQLSKALSKGMVFLITLYQYTFAGLFGGRCRFEPTCSYYGIQAFRSFGFAKALKLTFRRLSRCHPFGASGFDPIPHSHSHTHLGDQL